MSATPVKYRALSAMCCSGTEPPASGGQGISQRRLIVGAGLVLIFFSVPGLIGIKGSFWGGGSPMRTKRMRPSQPPRGSMSMKIASAEGLRCAFEYPLDASGNRPVCRLEFPSNRLAGGQHALNKKLAGLTLAAMRERMSDLDRSELPSVEQAKELQAERQPKPELQQGGRALRQT